MMESEVWGGRRLEKRLRKGPLKDLFKNGRFRPLAIVPWKRLGGCQTPNLTIATVDRCEAVRNGSFLREPFFALGYPNAALDFPGCYRANTA